MRHYWLASLLLASVCGAQSDCIPQSTKAYFIKKPAAMSTRRWLANGDAGGKFVVVALDDAIWSSLNVFDAPSGALVWSHPLLGKANQIAVSADGVWAAVALNNTFCGSPKIQLWKLNGGTMLPKLPGWVDQQGYSVAFSNDSNMLAASVNGEILVWDTAGKLLAEITPPGFQSQRGVERIRALEFNSHQTRLSGSGNKSTYTWDWKTGKLVSTEKRAEEEAAAQSATPPKMNSTWPVGDGKSMQISGPFATPANQNLQLLLSSGKTLVIPQRGSTANAE